MRLRGNYVKVSVGQDSHRFDLQDIEKKCILGGVIFDEAPALSANSDGDVVLHAITNAVSGITCRNILGSIADQMCQSGITDSREYLKVAMKDLRDLGYRVSHLSVSIECKKPKIFPRLDEMRRSIGDLLGVAPNQVGITATTGEGLTDFGKGLGISVFCVLTVE